MNIRINLDEKDIARIIAEHFGVKVHEVTVDTEEEMRGYGMAEEVVHVATATVDAKIIPLEKLQLAIHE